MKNSNNSERRSVSFLFTRKCLPFPRRTRIVHNDSYKKGGHCTHTIRPLHIYLPYRLLKMYHLRIDSDAFLQRADHVSVGVNLHAPIRGFESNFQDMEELTDQSGFLEPRVRILRTSTK
jgi:hypothetical protein